MKIDRLTVGMLQEHTYFAIDEHTQKAFIIDPGAEAGRILDKVKKEGLDVQAILLTHGHFDHIGAAEAIREALGCQIIIHECGKVYLTNGDYNLSTVFGGDSINFEADQYVKAGDNIPLEGTDISFKVVFAPGHTSDGVAYYNDTHDIAFVGDIIFSGSIGRTDNPGGDMATLLKSIQENIFTLPGETTLYPGHGAPTNVKHEKLTNPFFNIYD